MADADSTSNPPQNAQERAAVLENKAASIHRSIAALNLVKEVVLYAAIALVIGGAVLVITKLSERDVLRDRLQEEKDRADRERRRLESEREEEAREKRRAQERAEREAERQQQEIKELERREKMERERRERLEAARLSETERLARDDYYQVVSRFRSVSLDVWQALPANERPQKALPGAEYLFMVADRVNAEKAYYFRMVVKGGEERFAIDLLSDDAAERRTVNSKEFAEIVGAAVHVVIHKGKGYVRFPKDHQSETVHRIPRRGGAFNASEVAFGDLYRFIGETRESRAPNLKYEIAVKNPLTMETYPLVELSFGERLPYETIRSILVMVLMDKAERELREKARAHDALMEKTHMKGPRYHGTAYYHWNVYTSDRWRGRVYHSRHSTHSTSSGRYYRYLTVSQARALVEEIEHRQMEHERARNKDRLYVDIKKKREEVEKRVDKIMHEGSLKVVELD